MPNQSRIIAMTLYLTALPFELGAEPKPKTSLSDPQAAMATMPLADILRLHNKITQLEKGKPVMAPVAATVDSIDLSGRLLKNAIDIEAKFSVSVLAQAGWVVLPLLFDSPTLKLTSNPHIEGASITKHHNQLVFVADKPGKYQFALSLLLGSKSKTSKQQANLKLADATLSRLRLRYDPALFRLLNKDCQRSRDGCLLYPKDDHLSVRWQHASPIQTKVVKRPPMTSFVASTHACVVTNLQGQLIVRVLYKLRFEGRKPLQVRLPERLALKKVFVNSSSVSFDQQGDQLNLFVQPARTGDTSASLELLLTGHQPGFLLSGKLNFSFPALSWDVHHFYTDLHLPDVFIYQWSGGSLTPAQTTPEVEYVHSIPQPGKRVSFQQQLVSNAPDLEITYAVDMTGQYFQANEF